MGEVELPTVRVGVRLETEPDALGAWLADGAAFDAAGAEALWIDVDPQGELDPLSLTAALGVVTDRTQVVLVLDDATAQATDLARRLNTIRGLCHDRLALAVDADRPLDESGRPGLPILRREPDGSGWIDSRAGAGDLSRWTPAATPQGRSEWRDMRAEAAARGVYGLVVPAGPLLLDILRNPHDPGGRRDLQLAQG